MNFPELKTADIIKNMLALETKKPIAEKENITSLQSRKSPVQQALKDMTYEKNTNRNIGLVLDYETAVLLLRAMQIACRDNPKIVKTDEALIYARKLGGYLQDRLATTPEIGAYLEAGWYEE